MATDFDAVTVYSKDPLLKKKDSEALINWVQNQPHLPEITETQAILFLRRWDHNLQAAKKGVDDYFTFRTYCSHLFLQRNSLDPTFIKLLDYRVAIALPKHSEDSTCYFLVKFLDSDLEMFDLPSLFQTVDMIVNLIIHQHGNFTDTVIIQDISGFTLEMLSKFDIKLFKKCLYYLQKVMLLKWKQYHLFNTVPFMDAIMKFINPFLEKELTDQLFLHKTVDDLVKYVPLEYLPKDYGGSADSIAVLHERTKQQFFNKAAFFTSQNSQMVDESKRTDKSRNVVDILERGSIKNGHFEID